MTPVGVVGASARAAAGSLARAGFAAWAVDLFADRDLARLAPVTRCPLDRYPDALPELCAAFPPGPVLYTGGLENHPAVVAALAARRPLWGNGPDVLPAVRDPFRLSETLAGNGFAYPRVLPPGEPCPAAGRWLMKARRSSGGLGVRTAFPSDHPGPDGYLQEFVPGPPLSAVFVAGRTASRLVGVTEQLVGTPWLHARPFHYAGTIGPVRPGPELEQELDRLGDHLRSACGLRGVYGVDFALNDGRACVIEVNPRYPASAEVLELQSGQAVWASGGRKAAGPAIQQPAAGPAIQQPAAGPAIQQPAAGPAMNPPAASRPPLAHAVVGKAVYHAARPFVFPAAGPWDADLAGPFDPWRLPAFADIPAPGEPVEAGSPVLTVFASGFTPDGCRRQLQSRAAELDILFGTSDPGAEGGGRCKVG